ncbi:hypothetical protein ABZ847_00945 [Streptomyces bauhiniae]
MDVSHPGRSGYFQSRLTGFPAHVGAALRGANALGIAIAVTDADIAAQG